jgi:hypothetical protein
MQTTSDHAQLPLNPVAVGDSGITQRAHMCLTQFYPDTDWLSWYE